MTKLIFALALIAVTLWIISRASAEPLSTSTSVSAPPLRIEAGR